MLVHRLVGPALSGNVSSQRTFHSTNSPLTKAHRLATTRIRWGSSGARGHSLERFLWRGRRDLARSERRRGGGKGTKAFGIVVRRGLGVSRIPTPSLTLSFIRLVLPRISTDKHSWKIAEIKTLVQG